MTQAELLSVRVELKCVLVVSLARNIHIDLLSQDNVVSKRKIPVELRFYRFFCCLEIYKRVGNNNEQHRKTVAGRVS